MIPAAVAAAKLSATFPPKTAQFPLSEGVRVSERYALDKKLHVSSHSVLF